MDVVRRSSGLRETLRRAREGGLRIGFVPTMGALHEGHLSLIRAANERADVTVVSVFVNPTQFAPGEDFESYPRNQARDVDLCTEAGADYIFMPEAAELYPEGAITFVDVEGISDRFEGVSRPGHFRGVATIVTKLLNIVQPDVAVFGQKDAQQLAVIRQLAEDLFLEVDIVGSPTVRDEDGLALSSRNAYLSQDEREAATAIPRAFEAVRRLLGNGENRRERLVEAARTVIEAEPLLRIDYIDLVDRTTFEPMESVERDGLMVGAFHCGKTRLLDNEILTPPVG
jgi:pantoate--beta-alanine ligase